MCFLEGIAEQESLSPPIISGTSAKEFFSGTLRFGSVRVANK